MTENLSIFEMKLAAMEEALCDRDILKAIAHPQVTDIGKWKSLIGKAAFDYQKAPESMDPQVAYLTFSVFLREPEDEKVSNLWVIPSLEIAIFTPENLMEVKEIPNISLNRNDYIAQLLIEKFGGRTSLGQSDAGHSVNLLGRLTLASNAEGSAGFYLFRKLNFSTKDLSCTSIEGR